MKNDYYGDVYVYAVPREVKPVIEDINEKALYERYPYSSYPNVKTHLPSRAKYVQPEGSSVISLLIHYIQLMKERLKSFSE